MARTSVPAFTLQFPLEQVRELAGRFPSEGDAEMLALGRAARERGHYRRDEFVVVCRWKTPRSGPLVAENDADVVEARTGVALSPASGERERIEALRSLRGVEWATASVLLHLAYPDRYPILDTRALHALGVRSASYSFRFWEAYVTACRDLATRATVDGRTLDQALWQWSREQGTPL